MTVAELRECLFDIVGLMGGLDRLRELSPIYAGIVSGMKFRAEEFRKQPLGVVILSTESDNEARAVVEDFLRKHQELLAAIVANAEAQRTKELAEDKVGDCKTRLAHFVGRNLQRKIFNVDGKAVILQWVQMERGPDRVDVSVEPLL